MDANTRFSLDVSEAGRMRRAAELLIREGAAQLEAAQQRDAESRRHGFSITRAVRCMTREGGSGLVDGVEREICTDAAARAGRHFDPNKPFIPFAALLGQRALQTGTASLGGYLLGVNVPTIADALAPWSVALQAGVTVFDGLTSDVSVPREATAPSAQWLGEVAAGTASEPTFDGVSLSPKKALGYLEISGQLLKQGPLADAFIARALSRSLGRLVDQAIVAGTGTDGQPQGVIGASGVTSTVGTGLDYAGLLAEQEAVAQANVIDANHRFVGNPDAREILAARDYGTDSGRYLWDGDRVLGRPAFVTPDVPTATVVHGDWSAIALAVWGGGFQLEHNPYAGFQSNIHGFRAVIYCDVGILQPAALRVLTGIT